MRRISFFLNMLMHLRVTIIMLKAIFCQVDLCIMAKEEHI